MSLPRRQFLHRSAVAAGVVLASPWRRSRLGDPTPAPAARFLVARRVDPAVVHTLALRAIDAARTAGATYADVRLTRTVTQQFLHVADSIVGATVSDEESLAVGVRALVNGAWGFAASPYWELDEVVQLAQAAVSQAQVNALGTPHPVDWSAMPAATGTWTTPGIDPFGISIEEKIDLMNSWRETVLEYSGTPLLAKPGFDLFAPTMSFTRQERALASTEGSYVTQTLLQSFGSFRMDVATNWQAANLNRWSPVDAHGLAPQGKGWELFTDAELREQIPHLLAEADAQLTAPPPPVKPVEIGRYDVVFDAETMAHVLDQTLGLATQLDRTMGYEANAGGTSYLGPDPLTVLGAAPIGSPLVTVTANRSLPGGLATVRWDDEGVEPVEFPLVQAGELVDFQTTREQAAWLTPWYATQHRPVCSHGCAMAASALAVTLQQCPNLALTPAPTAASFEDLVRDTPHGVAVTGGLVFTDQQARTGVCFGDCREIVNGKLGARLNGASLRFQSLDFWKHLIALGGRESIVPIALSQTKGEPEQQTVHTVSAVPARVANVSIVGRG